MSNVYCGRPEDLKKCSDNYIICYINPVMNPDCPDYNKKSIAIVIYGGFSGNSYAQIDGTTYDFESEEVTEILTHVRENCSNYLTSWSMRQTKANLNENGFDGGTASFIEFKCGNLTCEVNGQTRDMQKNCIGFINNLVSFIISLKNKNEKPTPVVVKPKTKTKTKTKPKPKTNN